MSISRDQVMPIEQIDDWSQRLARQDAFWECEIIDRPVVSVAIPKESPAVTVAPRTFDSIKDRWFDSEYVAQCGAAAVENTQYLGDALPYVWPNLGPDIFAAFMGLDMEYAEDTVWATHSTKALQDLTDYTFHEDNEYWKKIEEMTRVLLEAGKNKFYTGYTDLHPGGDALAAFRNPEKLSLDLLMDPDSVKNMVKHIDDTFRTVFDKTIEPLRAAHQAIVTWAGVVTTKAWHVPSNDYSCMISNEMFEDFFAPGIAAECRHAEASLYHLDGPGALQHLDSLLAIPELSAIQWVPGAGNGGPEEWISVYQRIQAAGKGIQVYYVNANNIDALIENLRPEGVWLWPMDVSDREEAEVILKKVERWT